MENLLSVIRQKKETFPKRRRMLCNYILDNPVEASMLTIPELASRANIGSATVIRTIQALGYDSVSRFKSDLRNMAFAQASSSFSSYLNMNHINSESTQGQSSLSASLALYGEYLASLDNPTFFGQLDRAAEHVLSARHVYVLGLRTSLSIAGIIEANLFNAGIPTYQLGARADLVYDHIMDMTTEDLLFAIASPPVAEQTVKALRACHQRHVPIIVMAHMSNFPASDTADVLINTESFGLPFPTVPLALAAEMLSTVIEQRITGTVPRVQQLEEFLRENRLSVWNTEDRLS